MSTRTILTLVFAAAQQDAVFDVLDSREARTNVHDLDVETGRDPVRLTFAEVSGVGDIIDALVRKGVTFYGHHEGTSQYPAMVTISIATRVNPRTGRGVTHQLPAYGETMQPAIPLAWFPDEGNVQCKPTYYLEALAFNKARAALFGDDGLFGIVDACENGLY